MTRTLNPGLLAEGESDELFLAPLLRRQLRELTESSPRCEVDVAPVLLADRRTVHDTRQVVSSALRLSHSCHVLFVHRDHRERGKVERLVQRLRDGGVRQPVVALVPIRETEAWMLADRDAPPGFVDTAELPFRPRDVEKLADPKSVLSRMLRVDKGPRGRSPRDYFELLGRNVNTRTLAALPAYAAWVEETTRILKELRYI